jgi:hypothetical protein
MISYICSSVHNEKEEQMYEENVKMEEECLKKLCFTCLNEKGL